MLERHHYVDKLSRKLAVKSIDYLEFVEIGLKVFRFHRLAVDRSHHPNAVLPRMEKTGHKLFQQLCVNVNIRYGLEIHGY